MMKRFTPYCPCCAASSLELHIEVGAVCYCASCLAEFKPDELRAYGGGWHRFASWVESAPVSRENVATNKPQPGSASRPTRCSFGATMYTLSLTADERKAIDWIGNRYAHGYELRRVLL